jgi:hypothetical protein
MRCAFGSISSRCASHLINISIIISRPCVLPPQPLAGINTFFSAKALSARSVCVCVESEYFCVQLHPALHHE